MADHIQITAAPGRYRIRVGDTLIGQTDQAKLLVEGGGRPVVYVPRQDMRMGLLEATSRKTSCPWKGQASYFSVKADSGRLDNVVWSYEDPKPGSEAIAGHLAFYPAVTVEKV